MVIERDILRSYADGTSSFSGKVKQRLPASFPNPVSEKELGHYRRQDRQCLVTTDMEILTGITQNGLPLPTFLEAGPRSHLAYRQHSGGNQKKGLRIAIATTGGLAPGLNSVVHSIVERHEKTYGALMNGGQILGIKNGIAGLLGSEPDTITLCSEKTKQWLPKGGTELGTLRCREIPLEEQIDRISENLKTSEVDILYLIGGDGSQRVAHGVAEKSLAHTTVAGIPKTMDNDILWIWNSFGFKTAVERATDYINTMHNEAHSTRRCCIIELFGANSGFVAANAALASGHINLVLIPELFKSISESQINQCLQEYCAYLADTCNSLYPYAVVVLAEGVGKILEKRGIWINQEKVTAAGFTRQFQRLLNEKLRDAHGRQVPTVINQPGHTIRAVPANAHDQVFCKRLGALVVDNALAGFTDFMISEWLTEYVLVPLELVVQDIKEIPIDGIFWKQVTAASGQPRFPMQWGQA
jgi:6-phosphofructokinase 1